MLNLMKQIKVKIVMVETLNKRMCNALTMESMYSKNIKRKCIERKVEFRKTST